MKMNREGSCPVTERSRYNSAASAVIPHSSENMIFQPVPLHIQANIPRAAQAISGDRHVCICLSSPRPLLRQTYITSCMLSAWSIISCLMVLLLLTSQSGLLLLSRNISNSPPTTPAIVCAVTSTRSLCLLLYHCVSLLITVSLLLCECVQRCFCMEPLKTANGK